MVGLIRTTTSEQAATGPQRWIYRSQAELDMRVAVERWGREKWPDARVCHELVMDRGKVRADVAFVSPDHFAVVEIKSVSDIADRLLTQVGMFRLACPEVWIAAQTKHIGDAELVRFLLPSVGVLVTQLENDHGPLPERIDLEQVYPACPGSAHPSAMLHLLWVDELFDEAKRYGLIQGKPRLTHANLVKRLLRLSYDEQIVAVCRQLRARNAFWRADSPIAESVVGGA